MLVEKCCQVVDVTPAVLPPDLQDLGMDDDQHDYDSVASDEDTDSELTAQNNNNTQRSNRAKVRNTLALSAMQARFSPLNGSSINQAPIAPS